ncbi:LOW QUALITY PROTEIN: dapper homolog 2 [Brachyhypopomus gauderio]|uniref:LOW QUALITY PROTEIN: dapper homolog 2 n=1 Tax=Brachyhypopomus gauderio TaxID=698409 RepID=UPI004042D2EA
MLSRKVPAEQLGMDRARVGERLQAALAGLEEMRFLRDTQRHMVLWALRMNDGDPVRSAHLVNRDVDATGEDQRLEATLTALKLKLTRLRRQDLGLKTHLQQLDEQLGELQLSMCRTSAEHLDTDSRPSSGFYELSDGGLGSLSNSCTSVYSECLSSSSQASPLPPPSGRGFPTQADSGRRRSADDSPGRLDIPRGMGVRLGSSGIRTASISSERARPRPVSTGDLDRVILPGLGCYRPTEVKTLALGSILSSSTMDPKYRNSLVSRNGTEMYRYPSPLHAVALQSPIFTLSGHQGTLMSSEVQERHNEIGLAVDAIPEEQPSGPTPAGYIVKQLQRGSSETNLQSGEGAKKGCVLWGDAQACSLDGAKAPSVSCELLTTVEMERDPQLNTVSSESPGGKSQPKQGSQEQVKSASICLEESSQLGNVQHLTDMGDHIQSEVMVPLGTRESPGRARTEGDDQGVHFNHDNKDAFKGVAPKSLERRRSFTSAQQEARVRSGAGTGGHATALQPEFVLAQFVPAGTQIVKVRQADKKTKAVKLRKRSNEKPLVRRHLQKVLWQEQDLERSCGTKTRAVREEWPGRAEREESHLGEECRLGEAPPLSCSHATPSGSGNLSGSQCHPQPTQCPRPSKSRKAPFSDQDILPLSQTRKKQSSRKWPSASEVQGLPAVTTCWRSREVSAHRVTPKPGMVRGENGRPHPGLPRPLLPCLSSPFFFSDVSFGHPPTGECGRCPSRCPARCPPRCPPRCESEYSAECPSLFHSTVTGSSEGELSDYTTNRFGDSESSGDSQTASASDSSLSLNDDDPSEGEENEGDLVWAKATVGPVAAGLRPQPPLRSEPHLLPEPSACRIKASRALKKKIRRFQPTSLKVMTLV